MTDAAFRTIPLVRRFPHTDPFTGDLYVTEVRRDPASGLTLSARFKIEGCA